MCRELEYKMAPGAPEALTTYMAMRKDMPFFANARTVRPPPALDPDPYPYPLIEPDPEARRHSPRLHSPTYYDPNPNP